MLKRMQYQYPLLWYIIGAFEIQKLVAYTTHINATKYVGTDLLYASLNILFSSG